MLGEARLEALEGGVRPWQRAAEGHEQESPIVLLGEGLGRRDAVLVACVHRCISNLNS